MEYDTEDDRTFGSIPEFGAIFMANTVTMKECFRRNVFALPSSKTKFVKQIKSGMVLFLYEYEKRQLFGVFQASSDGAVDIVPHAFSSSGKRFPAQVCFTLIWRCRPLPEKEIRDAIRENYYSHTKFKFGLSEVQVQRLLSLFSSRKLINKLPSHLRRGLDDEEIVGDDNFALKKRTYMEPSKFHDYRENLISGATEDECMMDDVVRIKDKIYPLSQCLLTDHHDSFLSKRRIENYSSGLSVNNDSENKISNDLGLSRSSVDECGVLTDKNESQAGNPSVGPPEARTANYDQVMRSNLDNGFGQTFSNKYCYKHLNENSLATENCLYCKYNIPYMAKRMFSGHKSLSLSAHARETRDDYQCLMDMKSDNRYHVDRESLPGIISDFRHKAGEPDYVTCSMPGFLSENHALQSHCDISPYVNHVVSTENSPLSKPEQNMPSFGDKGLQERELSRLNVARDFVSSLKTYDDTIVSLDEPYIPEYVPCKHKGTACSTEAIDNSNTGIYHQGRESSNYDNQHFKFPTNLNPDEQQCIPKAPSSDSSARKSVFKRLTTGQDIHVAKEINGDHYNFNDHYMEATVEEVMEMLPLSKLKKVKVVEQPKNNKSDLFDNSHTTLENRKLEDAYVQIEEDTYEAPIETRTVDFKRRSEKRKSFISDAASDNYREVESPTTKILKHRKLVRPFFGKAVESPNKYHNLQSSDKAIGSCGGELPKDIAELPKVIAELPNAVESPRSYHNLQSSDKAIGTCLAELPKDIVKLPKDTVELPNDITELPKYIVAHLSMHCNSNEQNNYLEDQKEIRRLEELLKKIRQRIGLQTSDNVMSKETDANVTSANLEESTTSEMPKLGDISVENPKEENNLMTLKKKNKQKKKNDMLSKETDATVTSVKLEESTTSEMVKVGEICVKNPSEEDNLKKLKKKRKRKTRQPEGMECSK